MGRVIISQEPTDRLFKRVMTRLPWISIPLAMFFPSGESHDMVEERLWPFFEWLSQQNGSYLFVCQGGVMGVMDALLGNRPLREVFSENHFSYPNLGVMKYQRRTIGGPWIKDKTYPGHSLFGKKVQVQQGERFYPPL